jgi:regulator of replication initiation timing
MPIKRLYRMQRARLTATPLSLRFQDSWRTKILRWVLLATLLFSMLAAGYWLGQQQIIAAQMQAQDQQQSQSQYAQAQIASLSAQAALMSQQVTILRAERDTLVREQNQLQQELAAVRETLSFFESLLQSNDRSRLANFVACDLQAIEPGRYRYRLLLVQGMNRTEELRGRLQVSLQYVDGGKKGRISQGQDPVIPVKATHYARLEGELSPPASASNLLMDVQFLDEEGHQVQASCQKKV